MSSGCGWRIWPPNNEEVENLPNKQSRRADKGWYYGVGRKQTTLPCKQISYYEMLHRASKLDGILEGLKVQDRKRWLVLVKQ
jgi:hypothetical protein